MPLVPFLLAGIENKPSMFQVDQIHPTVQAQPLLLNNGLAKFETLAGRKHVAMKACGVRSRLTNAEHGQDSDL